MRWALVFALCAVTLCACGCGEVMVTTRLVGTEGDQASQGDPDTSVLLSQGLCASAGTVRNHEFTSTLCLYPLESVGQIAAGSNWTWIPGPAHIVERR